MEIQSGVSGACSSRAGQGVDLKRKRATLRKLGPGRRESKEMNENRSREVVVVQRNVQSVALLLFIPCAEVGPSPGKQLPLRWYVLGSQRRGERPNGQQTRTEERYYKVV